MSILSDLANGAALNVSIAWWAIEPEVLFALHWLGIAACAFVIGAVCCRIAAMNTGPRKASPVWGFIFTGLGVFAFGTLLDQIHGHPVDWYDSVGAFAISAYLLKTRHLWKHGAPKETDSRWHTLWGDK